MIPFEYRTPKSLKEVHATLKEFGGDAKLIAKGLTHIAPVKVIDPETFTIRETIPKK